jgi:hypothetical protein
MPFYTFLHNLLNVFVQIANKMGLQNKNKTEYFDILEWGPEIIMLYGHFLPDTPSFNFRNISQIFLPKICILIMHSKRGLTP